LRGGTFDKEALEAIVEIPHFYGLYSFQENVVSIVFDKEVKIEDY